MAEKEEIGGSGKSDLTLNTKNENDKGFNFQALVTKNGRYCSKSGKILRFPSPSMFLIDK